MGYYFMVLAALESNLESYQTKMKMLDDLVDMVDDKTVGT